MLRSGSSPFIFLLALLFVTTIPLVQAACSTETTICYFMDIDGPGRHSPLHSIYTTQQLTSSLYSQNITGTVGFFYPNGVSNPSRFKFRMMDETPTSRLSDVVTALVVNQSGCDIFLGPRTSRESVAIGAIMPQQIPWFSMMATSTALANKNNYPTFSRISPSDSVGGMVAARFAKHFHYFQASVICTDEPYGRSLADSFVEAFDENNGKVNTVACLSVRAGSIPTLARVESLVTEIKSPVVLLAMLDGTVTLDVVIQAIHNLNRTAKQVFLLSEGYCERMKVNSSSNPLFLPGFFCFTFEFNTSSPMFQAYKAGWDLTNPSTLYSGHWVPTSPLPLTTGAISVEDILASDAARVIVEGLLNVYQNNGSCVNHQDDTVISALRNVKTVGLTGNLMFDQNGDRVGAAINIYNAQPNGIFRKCATSDDSHDFRTLWDFTSSSGYLYWLQSGYRAPPVESELGYQPQIGLCYIYLSFPVSTDIVLLIGPDTSLSATYVAPVIDTPQISLTATSAQLSDKSIYPWFSRVCPTDNTIGRSLVALAQKLKFRKVSLIASQEPFGQSIQEGIFQAISYSEVSVTSLSWLELEESTEEVEAAVKRITSRVIIIATLPFLPVHDKLMQVLTRLNYHKTHVLFTSDCPSSAGGWPIPGIFCPRIAVNYTHAASYFQGFGDVQNDAEFEWVMNRFGLLPPLTRQEHRWWSGMALDGIQFIIHTFNNAYKNNASVLEAWKSDPKTMLEILRSGELTREDGAVTGLLKLDQETGDRIGAAYELVNIQTNSSLEVPCFLWNGVDDKAVHLPGCGRLYWMDTGFRDAAPVFEEEAEDWGFFLPIWLLAVIATIGFGIVLIIVVILIWARFKEKQSHVRFAPTKTPIAIIFTDVEESTFLWDSYQLEMNVAMDLHHALMRQLLEQYECYEVKTVGDSFIIACPTLMDAAMLAVVIQKELMTVKWPEAINAATGSRRNRDPVLWRGLAVRIGIHWGDQIEPKFDRTTRRYDYYGPDVNLASRVESAAQGGQILLTQECAETLRKDPDYPILLSQDCRLIPFVDNVFLRGFQKPITLVTLLPKELAGRQFVPKWSDNMMKESSPFRSDTQSRDTNFTSVSLLGGSYPCSSLEGSCPTLQSSDKEKESRGGGSVLVSELKGGDRDDGDSDSGHLSVAETFAVSARFSSMFILEHFMEAFPYQEQKDAVMDQLCTRYGVPVHEKYSRRLRRVAFLLQSRLERLTAWVENDEPNPLTRTELTKTE